MKRLEIERKMERRIDTRGVSMPQFFLLFHKKGLVPFGELGLEKLHQVLRAGTLTACIS